MHAATQAAILSAELKAGQLNQARVMKWIEPVLLNPNHDRIHASQLRDRRIKKQAGARDALTQH
jgi:hypothetical protein